MIEEPSSTVTSAREEAQEGWAIASLSRRFQPEHCALFREGERLQLELHACCAVNLTAEHAEAEGLVALYKCSSGHAMFQL